MEEEMRPLTEEDMEREHIRTLLELGAKEEEIPRILENERKYGFNAETSLWMQKYEPEAVAEATAEEEYEPLGPEGEELPW